jgi:hypothetical protein
LRRNVASGGRLAERPVQQVRDALPCNDWDMALAEFNAATTVRLSLPEH